MSIFRKTFFDSSGNFDNTKIIALLKKAQKEQMRAEF